MTRPATGWGRRFVIGFSAAFGLCVLVNFVVNPYGYYSIRLFRPLAWNSRAEKVALLRMTRPSALILGSSRTMKIAPKSVASVTGFTAFNASVDSARSEDLQGLYYYSKVRLRQPVRLVVLGIDLELFNEGFGLDDRMFAVPELHGRLSPSAIRRMWISRTKSLISSDQFAASIQSIWLALTGYPEPANSFDADGLVHYRIADTRKSAGTFTHDLQSIFPAYEQRFGFRSLGFTRRSVFEEFLLDAQRDGTQIVAFVTPLHPALIAHLRSVLDFDAVHSAVVEYLAGIQARFPMFHVRDFTDIESFAGDPSDFIDAAHVGDENSRRIVNALFRQSHVVQ